MAENKLRNQSQLDFGGVLKNVHDEQGGSLFTNRVKSRVPGSYDRAVTTYTNKNLTNIKFYSDELSEVSKIATLADVAGSLNNTYFILYSALDQTLYHVWFNVSAGGTDPSPTNSTPIEIQIQTNDTSVIVAEAIRVTVGSSIDFTTSRLGSSSTVETSALGDTTDTLDFNTGFTFTKTQDGVSVLLSDITPQNTTNILYFWNEFEGKVESQSNTGVNTLNPYIPHEIDVVGSITYIGSMDVEGVWFIKRLTENGKDTSIEFANESNNTIYTDFTTAWTNRLLISYDLIENLTNV